MRIHCETTGAPALFVHIVFQNVEPGRLFSAGQSSRLSLITGTIREGCTIETRQQMTQNLADAWVTTTGVPINDVLVAIEEIDPQMAMELGLIFPNPGEEPVWFEQHKDRLAELGVTSPAAPAPIPDLPSGDEVVAAPPADDDGITLFSAIDPRFDQTLVDLLEKAAEGDVLLCTSALSRYSRNSEKLHRILAFLLAHGATILATTYLIRPADVWVRRGTLVKPDSSKPYAGVLDTRGLARTHRKVAETVARQHGLR